MNKKVREERFRSFAPLTKAQRDELSEDEIKKWEEKAMSGMLRGDTILRSAMDSLRGKWSGTSSATNDVDMRQLFQIGLSTGADFTNGGKMQCVQSLDACIDLCHLATHRVRRGTGPVRPGDSGDVRPRSGGRVTDLWK
ncbi:flagellar filament capping protein FliD [Bacillus subtilis]